MDGPHEQDSHHVLTLLQSLKKASKDLQIKPISNVLNRNDSQPTIEALLDLGTEVDAVAFFSADVFLLNLSGLLTNLKNLSEKLEKLQGYDLRHLFRRQITKYKIFRVACSIEAEIKSYVDREIVANLVPTLMKSTDEDEKVKMLILFGKRLSQGFDKDFQELILRARVFSVLEFLLCGDSSCSKRVRNQACVTILGLAKFNKDVFGGLVMMGPTISALTSISSVCSIQVLCFFIGFIGTPLVHEIEANGEIPRIISLLSSEDEQIKVSALNGVLEMAFLGRREVIEKMIREGLVEKLMALQRTGVERECGCIGAEFVKYDSPFGNCVVRFAEQIQLGEGLERREKKETRADILRRVREASISHVEAAAIVAEVLWVS